MRLIPVFLLAAAFAAVVGCSSPTVQTRTEPDTSGAPAPVAQAPLPAPSEAMTMPLEPFVLGQADASVTLEEYSDFQCKACGQFARRAMPDIIAQYIDTGKIKVVWRDFAWMGDTSRQAAQAARCAGAQGKFWEYHDQLFEHQGQFAVEDLRRYASDLGLDGAAFASCLETAQDLPALLEQMAAVKAHGLKSTPALFINGQQFTGFSAEQLMETIDEELATLGK